MRTAILFDLDGTLLPMDLERFTKGYFGLLTAEMAKHGYDPQLLVKALLSGIGAMGKGDGSVTANSFSGPKPSGFWETAVSGTFRFSTHFTKTDSGAQNASPNRTRRFPVRQLRRHTNLPDRGACDQSAFSVFRNRRTP